MSLPARKKQDSGKKDAGKRSPAHRAFVRSFACSACGSVSGVECAHVRRASNSGMGEKPSDAYTLSLCRDCHAESHRGERTFEAKYKIDMMERAREFYFASPHRWKLVDPYG